MMKSGVPLLQAFDIVGRGHSNPTVGKLLLDIKADVKPVVRSPKPSASSHCNSMRLLPTWSSRRASRHSRHVIGQIGSLKEKIIAIKSKIKSAMFYPISILVVAFVITAVIMIFVIPAFKEVFKSFGADFPAPTLVVMAISDFFVTYWWAIFGIIGGGFYAFFESWKRWKRCR